jgi:hypothetical protein
MCQRARFCRSGPFRHGDAGRFYRENYSENEPGMRFPPVCALDRGFTRCRHNRLLPGFVLIRAGDIENRPVAAAFNVPLLLYLSAARGNKAIKI